MRAHALLLFLLPACGDKDPPDPTDDTEVVHESPADDTASDDTATVEDRVPAPISGRVVVLDHDGVAVPISDAIVRIDGLPDALATTDLHGGFGFGGWDCGGECTLCVSSLGHEECSWTVTPGDEPVHVGDLALAREGETAIVRTSLADGRPCVWRIPQFGVITDTWVSLLDTNGNLLLGPLRANADGVAAFLSPGVPEAVTAQATCEGILKAGPLDERRTATLPFDNQPPRVRTVEAWDNGTWTEHADLDAVLRLTVNAEDPDGDALTTLWVADGGVTQSREGVTWGVGGTPRTARAYALVGDGRGGYGMGRVTVAVGQETWWASGKVIDPAGQPIVDAQVLVNGRFLTRTTAEGGFFVALDGPADRYVVDVQSPGHAPVNRVFQRQPVDRTLVMPDCEQVTFNADSTVDLHLRSDPAAFTLRLPAGSLVDANGARVGGEVAGCLWSERQGATSLGELWQRPDRGDWQPIHPLGLVTAGFYDPADPSTVYSLRDGSGATLITADLAGLTRSDTWTVSIGQLDRGSGTWVRGGVASAGQAATLPPVREPGTWPLDAEPPELGPERYDATFAPYLTLLTDNAPGCLTIEADPYWFATGDFNVAALWLGPSGALNGQIIDLRSGVATVGPVLQGTNVVLDVLEAGVTGPHAVVSDWHTVTNVPPASVYVEVSPQGVSRRIFDPCVRVSLPQDPPPRPYFLTRFLSSGGADAAAAYYEAIDPGLHRTTLQGFLAINGWTGPNYTDDDAAAWYRNGGDLGFGRDMHLRRFTDTDGNPSFAMYVSNYPTADHAVAGEGLIATVAMEWSIGPKKYQDSQGIWRTGRYTKFYVFGPDGDRILGADLDGYGEKFVPDLCSNCHGGDPRGDYDPVNQEWTEPDLWSHFLPFALETFTYPTGSDPSLGVSPLPRAVQEEEFRKLNGILLSSYQNTARLVIGGWYDFSPGDPTDAYGLPPGAVQDSEWVPDQASGLNGWAGHEALYQEIYQPYCRSCHIAQAWAPNTGGLTFPGSSMFLGYSGSIQYDVCDQGVMPHAWETYKHFWTSQRPEARERLVDLMAAAGASGTWTQGVTCATPPQ